MSPTSLVSLTHAAGFLTGIALYAMLVWMTWRDGRDVGGQGGRDRLPVASALLGLAWNLGALLFYGTPVLGLAPASPLVGVAAFSALGFLPAAVVQSAVRGQAVRVRRVIVGLAYTVSTASFVLQVLSVPTGATPARAALLLLTVGYGSILVVLALLTRQQRNGRGMFASAGLAVFAVMALHLSQHRDGADSVLIELVGHQGSLPLVLVILYHNYRFAFADLFLKRALSLLSIVTIAIVAYLPLNTRLTNQAFTPDGGIAAIVVYAVCMALAYPVVERLVGLFVDRVVLRRVDYRVVRQELSEQLRHARTEEDVLESVRRNIAPALSADDVRTVSEAATEAVAMEFRRDSGSSSTTVTIPCAESPSFSLVVSGLRGGRRLLSDDLAFLESTAVAAARRIDGLRVDRERFSRAAAEIEVLRLVSEAELRALRAQLDPHFLFNSLTTIGHLLSEAPDRALSTLLRLTELLRAVLRPSATDLVTLDEEIEIVTAYLAIEHARFEDRLRFVIDVPDALLRLRIPPLLLQPLVENAVKHGIAPLRRGGVVRVTASLDAVSHDGRTLRLTVADSGAGVAAAVLAQRRVNGVGLRNVEQRLFHQFGARGGLHFESSDTNGTTVQIWLPVAGGAAETERANAPQPSAVASRVRSEARNAAAAGQP